jgi:hypothetical protein
MDKIKQQTLNLQEIVKPPYANIEGDIIGNEYISLELSIPDLDDSNLGCYLFQSAANWIEAAMREKYERDFVRTCANAERTTDGKCVGYQVSEFDDEPSERCKKCKINQFYEEE